MKQNPNEKPQKGNWLITGIFYLALGSIGPFNIYLFIDDKNYIENLSWWKLLIIPFGIWLLTGFILNGATVLYAGIRGQRNWKQTGERAWEWWLKLGLWLLCILIAFIAAAVAFRGVANLISSLDRGTVLIASLLLMILLALWRIGDLVKRG